MQDDFMMWIVIIKMMLARIKSSKNNMPLPQQRIIEQKQQLREKTRQLISKPSSQATSRKISTALFTTTSRSNAFFKPHTQQRNRETSLSYVYRPQSAAQFRPFTHQTSRCHRVRSPLSVIRTRSKCESINQQLKMNRNQSISQRKTSFLRKGSAIDKAVISNILKSKLNKNVCMPAFGYCDVPQNKQLVAAISNQIPKSIRDIVGAEEMVRMSHIFTGTQFKCISLTHKVNEAIQQRQFNIKTRNKSQDQESITLKSIKRW